MLFRSELVFGHGGDFAFMLSVELFSYQRFGLLDIEVADQNQSHVVGHVIGVVELAHLGRLQVLGRAIAIPSLKLVRR